MSARKVGGTIFKLADLPSERLQVEQSRHRKGRSRCRALSQHFPHRRISKHRSHSRASFDAALQMKNHPTRTFSMRLAYIVFEQSVRGTARGALPDVRFTLAEGRPDLKVQYVARG